MRKKGGEETLMNLPIHVDTPSFYVLKDSNMKVNMNTKNWWWQVS